MSTRNAIYKCEICGNMVDHVHVGGGTLSCCGKPMTLQTEMTADTSTEKHVPFIQKTDQGVLVKVGETVDHPMMEAHYIQWIELLTERAVYRKFLTPQDKPQALFLIASDEKVIGAREFCNLHGLWKG